MDRTGQVAVVSLGVRGTRCFNGLGEFDWGRPPRLTRPAAALRPKEVSGDLDDVVVSTLRVDPPERSCDTDERGLGRILRTVRPESPLEEVDERRPKPGQENLEGALLAALRFAHEVTDLVLIQPYLPRVSHSGAHNKTAPRQRAVIPLSTPFCPISAPGLKAGNSPPARQ